MPDEKKKDKTKLESFNSLVDEMNKHLKALEASKETLQGLPSPAKLQVSIDATKAEIQELTQRAAAGANPPANSQLETLRQQLANQEAQKKDNEKKIEAEKGKIKELAGKIKDTKEKMKREHPDTNLKLDSKKVKEGTKPQQDSAAHRQKQTKNRGTVPVGDWRSVVQAVNQCFEEILNVLDDIVERKSQSKGVAKATAIAQRGGNFVYNRAIEVSTKTAENAAKAVNKLDSKSLDKKGVEGRKEEYKKTYKEQFNADLKKDLTTELQKLKTARIAGRGLKQKDPQKDAYKGLAKALGCDEKANPDELIEKLFKNDGKTLINPHNKTGLNELETKIFQHMQKYAEALKNKDYAEGAVKSVEYVGLAKLGKALKAAHQKVDKNAEEFSVTQEAKFSSKTVAVASQNTTAIPGITRADMQTPNLRSRNRPSPLNDAQNGAIIDAISRTLKLQNNSKSSAQNDVFKAIQTKITGSTISQTTTKNLQTILQQLTANPNNLLVIDTKASPPRFAIEAPTTAKSIELSNELNEKLTDNETVHTLYGIVKDVHEALEKRSAANGTPEDIDNALETPNPS